MNDLKSFCLVLANSYHNTSLIRLCFGTFRMDSGTWIVEHCFGMFGGLSGEISSTRQKGYSNFYNILKSELVKSTTVLYLRWYLKNLQLLIASNA